MLIPFSGEPLNAKGIFHRAFQRSLGLPLKSAFLQSPGLSLITRDFFNLGPSYVYFIWRLCENLRSQFWKIKSLASFECLSRCSFERVTKDSLNFRTRSFDVSLFSFSFFQSFPFFHFGVCTLFRDGLFVVDFAHRQLKELEAFIFWNFTYFLILFVLF